MLHTKMDSTSLHESILISKTNSKSKINLDTCPWPPIELI